MRIINVTNQEAGQRLDKLLFKYLNQASMSFIFKMLRKKNITLNGKKADGSEKLKYGDEIKLFLSDETFEKFSEMKEYRMHHDVVLDIIYEDTDILLINKPVGMLSQKAQSDDVSLNEYCIDYLLKNGSITDEVLRTFKPAVCNRLDRNTSGIVICGKSLIGLQSMSEMLKNRSIQKFYQCLVKGTVETSCNIQGYLVKDHDKNHVSISTDPQPNGTFIETRYHPIQTMKQVTLLEVELITGKSHQIRAHLASIGHPIIGDQKYGDPGLNKIYRSQYHVKSQLLHAQRLVMPLLDEPLAALSGREFKASLPELFQRVLDDM